MFTAHPAAAQISVTKGTNLSVDVASDGRLAIDLMGDIWTVPAGGGDATQLTQDMRTARLPRWSPDGSKLAYQATVAGEHGLWVYDFTSGRSENVLSFNIRSCDHCACRYREWADALLAPIDEQSRC